MSKIRRRDAILVFGFAVPFSSALIIFIVGPMYLRPLPIWTQLAIVVAGCCVIAAIAVYSRRRARRSAQSR